MRPFSALAALAERGFAGLAIIAAIAAFAAPSRRRTRSVAGPAPTMMIAGAARNGVRCTWKGDGSEDVGVASETADDVGVGVGVGVGHDEDPRI